MGMTDLQFKSWLLQLIARLKNVQEEESTNEKDKRIGEIIEEFESKTGRGVLCNKTYSGTEVIKDYGKEHLNSGDLIVYTSADSVFQIAAHEQKVSLDELYECCRIAREILKGEHAVGRVIARPFVTEKDGKKETFIFNIDKGQILSDESWKKYFV